MSERKVYFDDETIDWQPVKPDDPPEEIKDAPRRYELIIGGKPYRFTTLDRNFLWQMD